MNAAAAALARAEAAGVRLRLRPGGGVRVEAARPPPPDVVADLRRWRDDVAALLAARDRPAEVTAAEPAGGQAAAEAEAMALHFAAPAELRPYQPGDPDPLRDALLAMALMRPPAWEGDAPPQGAWCSCCGRHAPQAGGRWWTPHLPRIDGIGTGPGWRCWTCHPPDHLPAAEVREVRT